MWCLLLNGIQFLFFEVDMNWTCLPLNDIPDFRLLIDYVEHFAKTAPEEEAAVDYLGSRWTHQSFAGLVDCFASEMLERGVEPGMRVAVAAGPCTHAWASCLAASSIGAIWLGLNPRYTEHEFARLINDAEPSLLYLSAQLQGNEAEALTAAAGDLKLLSLEDVGARTVINNAALTSARVLVDPEKPCLLVYTSGSTGNPKGALLGQAGVVACSRVQAHHYGMKGGRSLNPLPINHVGALCDTATTILMSGGAQIFIPFDPSALLEAIGKERISLLGGVPTMFQLLVANPAFAKTDFSSVKRLLWSGTQMSEPLLKILLQLGKPIHNFYGMTELSGSITFTDPEASPEEVAQTIGRPDSSYPVRIADPATGQACEAGSIGEIQTKSPGVCLEYLGQPEATAEAFSIDGWFKTGDLARELPGGQYVLCGRIREMFKSGGYNVFPLEIEIVIESFPGVVAACVVPMPDPLYNEVGRAFVMIMPGMTIDETALISALRERLANYKIPKSFTFVDELPILPVGKIDRKAVAAMAVASQP
jgi:acyl-CoA synthetase (AMP-forming)/AMP-acid ligase II